MVKQNNYSASLRLPSSFNEWINQFADKWNVSKSCIYRAAIKDFITKQSMNQGR